MKPNLTETDFYEKYQSPGYLIGTPSNVHIPEQSGHRFRHYPDSHSAINRTLILR